MAIPRLKHEVDLNQLLSDAATGETGYLGYMLGSDKTGKSDDNSHIFTDYNRDLGFNWEHSKATSNDVQAEIQMRKMLGADYTTANLAYSQGFASIFANCLNHHEEERMLFYSGAKTATLSTIEKVDNEIYLHYRMSNPLVHPPTGSFIKEDGKNIAHYTIPGDVNYSLKLEDGAYKLINVHASNQLLRDVLQRSGEEDININPSTRSEAKREEERTFDAAITKLEQSIRTGSNAVLNQQATYILKKVKELHAEATKNTKLPLYGTLNETLLITADIVIDPTNIEYQKELNDVTKIIRLTDYSDKSKGTKQLIAGIALFVVGAALLAGAIMASVASFGVATPLSAVGIKIAVTVLAKALTIAASAIAALFTIGMGCLIKKSHKNRQSLDKLTANLEKAVIKACEAAPEAANRSQHRRANSDSGVQYKRANSDSNVQYNAAQDDNQQERASSTPVLR